MTHGAGRRRWGPAVFVGFLTAVGLASLALVFSRPDVAAMGLPLALLSALAVTRPDKTETAAVAVRALPLTSDGTLRTEVSVTGEAETAELVIVQSSRRRRHLIVPVGGEAVVSVTEPLHSGPVVAVQASARGFSAEGAVLGAATDTTELIRNVAPVRTVLPALPLSPRLTGMHGSHEGRRPGQGGDFRDIHAFVPGDELRRVDWRATARMARRPGDLLVRRTNTLSDATIVIAMDTADDLGSVVATWGSGDLERSGETSLDRARQAAASIAASAIGGGDRVAFHVLMHGGRSVRAGAGARHLAKVEAAIAATGNDGEDARFRRTPPVPHGSVIFVLSTFFEGAASDVALLWRASGHRVVAVDTLPKLDPTRVSREQQVALRTVLAERDEVMHELASTGVDTVTWNDGIQVSLSALVRTRR